MLPQKIKFGENCVTVSGGVNIGNLIWQSAQKNLGGLEFLAGVPATVGGLVKMNAGAYGKTICPLVQSVCTIDKNGTKKELKNFDYAYRHTDLSGYIYEVCLRLQPKSQSQIHAEIKKNIAQRFANQPLAQPNLGCIFKNPPAGKSAGELIDAANLKEKQIGDAQISAKHANFIVNLGGATAADVLALIELVQSQIFAKFKIKLALEVKVL